jgi:hypothetical protein
MTLYLNKIVGSNMVADASLISAVDIQCTETKLELPLFGVVRVVISLVISTVLCGKTVRCMKLI